MKHLCGLSSERIILGKVNTNKSRWIAQVSIPENAEYLTEYSRKLSRMSQKLNDFDVSMNFRVLGTNSLNKRLTSL